MKKFTTGFLAGFFSSIWFRCISTLLIIIAISGGLLSVLSDVLYVSPEQRTERAIKKIYGEIEGFNQIPITDFDYDKGQINTIYEVKVNDNETYLLFKATGYEGYKGGTISLWVSVKENEGGTLSLNKVLLDSFDKQTLMGKLTSTFYGNFALEDITDTYEKGEFFTTDTDKENSNPISGATMSANAAVNAVNCVINYLGENYED